MPSSPPPRRAVVIEDDPDIRGLLARILVKEGFEVTETAAGLPGIEAVRAVQADLVTLDLNLPDMDGVEVCKKLREFSDAYIIMLTARVDELDRLTGLDNGADDYINKPFSPRELRSRVNALFRRSRTSSPDAEAQDDLVHAGKVQQSLLPTEKVQLDGYEVAGVFRPCRSVGGDFYDWYQTPDGLHLTFADAMGKGMGAALIAATTRAVMRSVRYMDGLEAAFSAASSTIEADLDGTGSFVTMFHARLDADSGRVSYIDAGHGLALHVRSDGGAARLRPAGPPVGAWAGTLWHEAELDLFPGDALVVVSDGVLDVFPSVEELTAAVLQATLGHSSAQAVCNALLALAPAGSAEDDVTAVVVRRLADRSRPAEVGPGAGRTAP